MANNGTLSWLKVIIIVKLKQQQYTYMYVYMYMYIRVFDKLIWHTIVPKRVLFSSLLGPDGAVNYH